MNALAPRALSRTSGLRAFWNLHLIRDDERDGHFREFTVARAEVALRHHIAGLEQWERTERDEARRHPEGPYRNWKRTCAEQIEWKAAAWQALLTGDMALYAYAYRETRLIVPELDAAQAAMDGVGT